MLITERPRPDIVALLIILALAYTHLLSTDEAPPRGTRLAHAPWIGVRFRTGRKVVRLMTSSDPERSTHDLVNEVSRPLTEQERKAADRDTPVAQPVYAPASERVPREPVAGHRDFVEHPDPATPERQAATHANTATEVESEPSFTRVPRPSNSGSDQTGSETWSSGSPAIGAFPPMGVGWAAMGVCTGVGVWLWMRWRRERNKPINRIRRQARQTASQARQTAFELRERMPEFPDEATRPAVGLGTALISLALVLWQQSQQSRSRLDESRDEARAKLRWGSREASKRAEKATREASKHAQKVSQRAGLFGRKTAETLSELDWQDRLMQRLASSH